VRLVVTHLTRMKGGHVCVAGQDVRGGASVRPVLQGQRLPRSALSAEGGPYGIGGIVELSGARPCGRAPEVEDYAYVHAQRVGSLDATRFWQALARVARPSLQAIFGPEMEPQGRTAALPLGKGAASLGVLAPRSRPVLTFFDDHPRLSFRDEMGPLDVALTDVRLVQADHAALDPRAVETLRKLLAAGECLLCVGVGRPWAREEGEPPRHWLQVNNVHVPGTVDWSA